MLSCYKDEVTLMLESLKKEILVTEDKYERLLLLYKIMCLTWCNEKDIYSITDCTPSALLQVPYFMHSTILDLWGFVKCYITYGRNASTSKLECVYGTNGVRFLSNLLRIEQEVPW